MKAAVQHEFDFESTFVVDLDHIDEDGEPATIAEFPSIENGGALGVQERIKVANFIADAINNSEQGK